MAATTRAVRPRGARGIGGLTSAASVREQARAYLLSGDVQRAVWTLEAATERDPGDALLWSDLAGALLARAELRERPEDLLEALDAVDGARALAPDALELIQTCALVFEALFLDDQAREAWTSLAVRAGPASPLARTAQEQTRIGGDNRHTLDILLAHDRFRPAR